MSAIEAYAKAKQDFQEAIAFQALLIAGKVTDVEVSFRVRGGESRANLPDGLKRYLERQVEKKADKIVADSLAAMNADLQVMAGAVMTEYRQIAADAGLTLPAPAPNPVP